MIAQGDIILVPFPFSNLSSQKVRPALVISNASFAGEDIIVCGISSKSGKGEEVILENEDLEEGALPVQSYIKIGKLVSLNKSIIRKKVATLCKKKKEEVWEKTKVFLEVE